MGNYFKLLGMGVVNEVGRSVQECICTGGPPMDAIVALTLLILLLYIL